MTAGRAVGQREAGRLHRRLRRATGPERPVNPRDTAAPVAAFKGTQTPLRPDLALLAEMVAPGSRVLDIGCSDGALLEFLAQPRGVTAPGRQLAQKNANACVAPGLSALPGAAAPEHTAHPSAAFNCASPHPTTPAPRT